MHLFIENLVELGLEAGAVDDFAVLLHDGLVLFLRTWYLILIQLLQKRLPWRELLRVHVSKLARFPLDLLLVLEELV